MYQPEELVCIKNLNLKRIFYFPPVFLLIIQIDHNLFNKFWNQSFYPTSGYHNSQVQHSFNCQWCYGYCCSKLVSQFSIFVVNLSHQFHDQAFCNQLSFIFLKLSLDLNHHKRNVQLQELITYVLNFKILEFCWKKDELKNLILFLLNKLPDLVFSWIFKVRF